MNILNLIRKIGDAQEYSPRQINKTLLDHILEAARWTPSAANSQPWEVYIVENAAIKARLDGCLLDSMLQPKRPGKIVAHAPLVMAVGFDSKRATARFGRIGEKLFAVQDTATAIAHMRLAAMEKGVHLTWIREADLGQIARVLKLTSSVTPVALLTLGYARQKPEKPPALSTSYWVHRISD